MYNTTLLFYYTTIPILTTIITVTVEVLDVLLGDLCLHCYVCVSTMFPSASPCAFDDTTL